MFTVVTKITCYFHCCYKDYLLCALLLHRRLLITFTLLTRTNTYVHSYHKEITCYVHCYYKEKIPVFFTVITKKLLVMVTVVTKKITCYVHCYHKENYFLCSLLL